MRPIIFLGTNDNLEVALRICDLCKIPVAGIIDSDWFGQVAQKNNIDVIGSENTFDFKAAQSQFNFFVGSSFIHWDPRSRSKRAKYIDLIAQHNLNCATLIHPYSEIYTQTNIGPGCLIGFGVGISHHVKIGAHSQVHTNALIAHHSCVGTNTVIHTSVVIGSNINIGNNVVIHPRATIIPTGVEGHIVGDGAEIHPCVTVCRDVEQNEIIGLSGSNSRRIFRDVVRQVDTP